MSRVKAVEPIWCLTDHACRVCFGRILMRTTADGLTLFRCANCGTEVSGGHVKALCWCGMKTPSKRDAGFRCQRNPNPCPEHPVEIVVRFVGVDAGSGTDNSS